MKNISFIYHFGAKVKIISMPAVLFWLYLRIFGLFLMQINAQLQFVELFRVEHARGVEHHVAAAVVLREGDTVADGVEFCEDAHEAVETESKSCVRRCAIFECVDEEAELGHSALRCETEYLEHLLLQFAVVDTQTASADLDAVAHEVVGLGTNQLRMLLEQGDVVRVGHGERVVGGHQALFLVAPLEEREVDNPQTLKLVLASQTQTVAHLETQRAELGASLVGLVAAEYEHEVAVLGSRLLFQLLQYLGRIEFVDARLDRAVSIEFHVDEALGSHLRTLDEVGQLVELLACVVGTARDADTADIFGIVEDGECSRAFEHVHQFDKLHAEAQVGLVATEAAHGLVPRHLLELCGQLDVEHFLEKMACHILEEVDDVVLIDEAHFAVYLCELRLTVGSQVLVAETLGYLEVAVETADHEQLFQCLRTLRQSVKLARVHS